MFIPVHLYYYIINNNNFIWKLFLIYIFYKGTIRGHNFPVFVFSSVQFSCSVVSDSLRPHESQHARPPCPVFVFILWYILTGLSNYWFICDSVISFIYCSPQYTLLQLAFQVALVVRSLSANEGDAWDSGSIPGSWRSPGGGHDNPIQYFWLENLMVREAWWVVVHGVAKSQTWLKRLGHTCRFLHFPLSFEFSKQASASGLWHFPLSLPGILFQKVSLLDMCMTEVLILFQQQLKRYLS